MKSCLYLLLMFWVITLVNKILQSITKSNKAVLAVLGICIAPIMKLFDNEGHSFAYAVLNRPVGNISWMTAMNAGMGLSLISCVLLMILVVKYLISADGNQRL